MKEHKLKLHPRGRGKMINESGWRIKNYHAPILLTGSGGHPLKVEISVRIRLGVQ